MTEEIPTTTVGDVEDLENPVLLDVRELDEYTAGHAPGVLFHPLATLPDIWSSLPTDRTIVCICRSGGRSAQATAFLLDQGLAACNLAGGMQAWSAFGLEVIGPEGTAGTVL